MRGLATDGFGACPRIHCPRISPVPRVLFMDADTLRAKLKAVKIGEDSAARHTACVREILQLLFAPDFDVYTEPAPHLLAFSIHSNRWFWGFIEWEHSGPVLFETYNNAGLETSSLDRLAARLDEHSSSLGFMVTRSAPAYNLQERTFAI